MYAMIMVTFTINIPQILASIYHTYGSVMGYRNAIATVVPDFRFASFADPRGQAPEKVSQISTASHRFHKNSHILGPFAADRPSHGLQLNVVDFKNGILSYPFISIYHISSISYIQESPSDLG